MNELASLQDIPGLPLGDGARRERRRICLATQEVNGPFRNGGIGTAYTTLAESLAAREHDVTLLFLRGDYCETRTMPDWIEHYADKGVSLVPLPSPHELRLHGPSEAAVSYAAYLWLKEREHDVIHFPELGGSGFYTLLAKRQRLAFSRTRICIGTHSPMLWIRESNQEFLHGVSDLEMDFMERQSVAMADVVVSPSRYLLEWMADRGWQIPETSYVQQNVLPSSARAEPGDAPTDETVSEIVFFGRLETRKGLELFMDAIDRLTSSAAPRPPVRITFLGRPALVRGAESEDFIRHRAKSWPWPHRVMTDLGQAEAMRYLKAPGRLAVIPSFVENSPYTVLECLGAGIPFLAAAVGGIPELIHPEDASRTCFPPRAAQLASMLERAITQGARRAAPAVDFDENEAAWIRWHDEAAPSPDSSPCVELPRLSVCLTHDGAPARLDDALAALRRQDYPERETIFAATAGAEPPALGAQERFVESAASPFGARRNEAAAAARGTYLLFTGTDQTLRPSALSTLARAALSTGAALVTCLGDAAPVPQADGSRSESSLRDRFLFLGGAAAVGLFSNTFGRAPLLVRRDVFVSLGGFSERARAGVEDWDFPARAVLAGHRLEVVPEALYEYEVDQQAFVDTGAPLRSLQPYLESVPDALRGLIEYTQSLAIQRPQLGGTTDETNHGRPSGLDALIRAGRILADDGHAEDAKMLVAKGLELAQRSGDEDAVVDFMVAAAPLLAGLDDASAAVDLVAGAIQIGSQARRIETFLKALIEGGKQLTALGEFGSAADALTAARELATRHGRDEERIQSMILSGWTAGSSGDSSQAKRALADALGEVETLDDERAQAALQLDAGARLAELGLESMAKKALLAAGQVGWQIGDRRLVADAQRCMRLVGSKAELRDERA